MILPGSFDVFFFVLLSVLTQGAQATTCSKVKIKGASVSFQDSRMDKVYEKLGYTQHGKPVFSRLSGTRDFIYWHNTQYTWYVGQTINSIHGVGLYVRSNESHPVDARNTWNVFDSSGSFTPYPSVYSTCTYDLEPWYISLILAAILLAAVAVALPLALHFRKAKTPESGSTNTETWSKRPADRKASTLFNFSDVVQMCARASTESVLTTLRLTSPAAERELADVAQRAALSSQELPPDSANRSNSENPTTVWRSGLSDGSIISYMTGVIIALTVTTCVFLGVQYQGRRELANDTWEIALIVVILGLAALSVSLPLGLRYWNIKRGRPTAVAPITGRTHPQIPTGMINPSPPVNPSLAV